MALLDIVHTETNDETKPAGSRAISLGDDDIREFKRTIRERLAIDHIFLADESGEAGIGIHKQVTMRASAGNPATYTDVGYVYLKTVSGVIELFYKDSAGSVIQITNAGAINVAAVLLTGDQTIAGVKTFSSIPILPGSDATTDNQAIRKAQQDAKFNTTTGHDHDGSNSRKLSAQLGALAAANVNQEYLAATDIEVSCLLIVASGTSTLDLVVDTHSSPTTIRQSMHPILAGTNGYQSFSFLVAKGESWKVNYSQVTGSSTPSVWQRPISA